MIPLHENVNILAEFLLNIILWAYWRQFGGYWDDGMVPSHHEDII